MAHDIVLTWTRARPSESDVESVGKRFFGDALAKAEWRGDRLLWTLVGSWSHPMKDLIPLSRGQLEIGEPPHDARVIEIMLTPTNLVIITRFADAYTTACARGLAKVFVDYWKAAEEP